MYFRKVFNSLILSVFLFLSFFSMYAMGISKQTYYYSIINNSDIEILCRLDQKIDQWMKVPINSRLTNNKIEIPTNALNFYIECKPNVDLMKYKSSSCIISQDLTKGNAKSKSSCNTSLPRFSILKTYQLNLNFNTDKKTLTATFEKTN